MTRLYDREALLTRRQTVKGQRPDRMKGFTPLMGRLKSFDGPIELDPDSITKGMTSGLLLYEQAERDIFESRGGISTGLNKKLSATNEALKEQIAMLSDIEEEQTTSEKPNNLINFIKNMEGFRSTAYFDIKDYAIGYGSKAKKGENITEEEATKRLRQELKESRSVVMRANKKHGYNWNTNQIDALTSFTHNLGQGNFSKLIDNGKRNNEQIIEFLPQYNKATKDGKLQELSGLTKRRNKEIEIFNQGYSA